MNCYSYYYFLSGMLLYQHWIITAIQSAYFISTTYLKPKLFKIKKASQSTKIQKLSISIFKKKKNYKSKHFCPKFKLQ